MSPDKDGGDRHTAGEPWQVSRTANGCPIIRTLDNAVAAVLAEKLGVLSKLQEITPTYGSGVVATSLVEDAVTGVFTLIIRYAGFSSQGENGWVAAISRDFPCLDDYRVEVQRRASLGASSR